MTQNLKIVISQEGQTRPYLRRRFSSSVRSTEILKHRTAMDEEQRRREIENLERLINGQETRIADKEGLKMRLIQMIQELKNQKKC